MADGPRDRGADRRRSDTRHWDAFYRFYLATSDRKWGQAYLNRNFFALIGERMPDKIVLVMARRDGKYVAGALNLLGKETIYGRNWGSYGDYKFLHFECCYYRAIEFAIARGLKRVEAGAQGPHKLQRGYLPVPTYSAHWIPDPAFRRAVAQFLARERDMVERKIEPSANTRRSATRIESAVPGADRLGSAIHGQLALTRLAALSTLSRNAAEGDRARQGRVGEGLSG